MLSDVRNGVNTEINFINGYIYRRGLEVGVQCVSNYMMMQLVQGKNNMIKKEMEDEVPMARVNQGTGERAVNPDTSRDYREGENADLQ